MIKITCFCSGITFPHGEATNNRIMMIGKALQMKNVQMDIYVNSEGNRNQLNLQLEGSVNGLNYRHLNGSMAIGLSIWKRTYNYLLIGFFNAALVVKQLSKDRENTIYLYSQGSLFNVWISFLARLYTICVVQEVNEWKEDIDKRKLHAFIYKKMMFRWAKGAIVISNNIALQVQRHKASTKMMEILLLPVLADKNDWANHRHSVTKTFVWCGLIEGYFKDVMFMIGAFSRIHHQYPEYRLIICGKYKLETIGKVRDKLKSLDVPLEKVELTGFISNEDLVRYCQSATALISPLWDDQASAARFPSKIADFLFSGRPVLTCNIGEVGRFLQDRRTALFFLPSNEDDLADKMRKMIMETGLANAIGTEGMALANDKFDYRVYADKLFDFFNAVSLS